MPLMRAYGGKKFVNCAMTLAMLATAPLAHACPPPPPLPGSQRIDGESDAAYRVRFEQLQQAERVRVAAELRQSRLSRQTLAWLTAEQIVVVEVAGISRTAYRDGSDGASPAARLRVVLRERVRGGGSGSNGQFLLGYQGNTSCGPYGPIRLDGLAEGQLFVVFARAGRLGMDTVIEAVREDEAVNPATLDLFEHARARR